MIPTPGAFSSEGGEGGLSSEGGPSSGRVAGGHPAETSAAGNDVTLVIPGRNAGRTLARAIDSALALPAGSLREVVFVDDGSTDDSAEIARRHGVVVLSAGGRGPGAARNVGWRRAASEWVWFVDADCTIEEGTLDRLLAAAEAAGAAQPAFREKGGTSSGTSGSTSSGREKAGSEKGGTSSVSAAFRETGGTSRVSSRTRSNEKGGTSQKELVSGVGGSYANAVSESLLARLVHAEIRERHLAMGGARGGETDYLGSFNVLYRRRALDESGGFDESWVNGPAAPGAEDADLSYRLAAAGHRLRFDAGAVVAHHYPVSLWRYLRAQRLHGFWGVRLYRRHPGRGRTNAYSGPLDHLQPVLALSVLVLTVLGALPLALLPGDSWRLSWQLPLVLLVLLSLSTLPMTVRLVHRRGAEMLAFAPLATVRAFARGLGMAWGVLDMLTPGDWRPRR